MDDIEFTNKETSVLNLFNSRPYKTINTLQFNESGFINVTRVVSKLRLKGAVIEVTQKYATDSFNNPHPRIAHYMFKGWEPIPPIPLCESSTTKK